MSILVTGAEGFAGSHLLRHLLSIGVPPSDITGTWYAEPGEAARRLGIRWRHCDVTTPAFLHLLQETAPAHIYHLAGQASVGYSFREPEKTITGNLHGVLHLLQWMRTSAESAPKALIVTSAEIYNDTGDIPRTESGGIDGLNFYTLSKLCVDKLCRMYYEYFHCNVVCARAFNHIGPGQSTQFALPSFAQMIAALEKTGGGTITTGDLNVWRDFTDVRDVVRAYRLLMEHGKAGEAYNICSGRMLKLEDLLTDLCRNARVAVHSRVSPEKLRQHNVEKLVGDYSKLHALTGWKPEIDIQTTLADILEYWRQQT